MNTSSRIVAISGHATNHWEQLRNHALIWWHNRICRYALGHTDFTQRYNTVEFMQSSGGHKGLTTEMNFKERMLRKVVSGIHTGDLLMVLKWRKGGWRQEYKNNVKDRESYCQSSGAWMKSVAPLPETWHRTACYSKTCHHTENTPANGEQDGGRIKATQ